MTPETRPPSGSPPPASARLPDGSEVELEPIAREICRIYREEFPDEQERYGDAGIAWCVHDNQHILNWAMADLAGFADLDQKMRWLAGILSRRDFPVARIVRNLEIGGGVCDRKGLGSPALGDRLRQAAHSLGSTLDT